MTRQQQAPQGPIILVARETWDQERLRDLRTRWWNGDNVWHIANDMWCNESTVWKKVRNYGFRRSPDFKARPRRRLSAAQLAEMRALFEVGTASWAIADKFDLDPGCVVQWARRRGWRRPVGFLESLKTGLRFNPSPAKLAWFREAWCDAKVTFYDLCGEMRASHPTLCKLAAALGLPARQRGDVMRARAAATFSYRDGIVGRLREAGATDEIAAAHFGISKGQVKRSVRRLRKKGVAVARLRRRWKPDAADEIAVRNGYRLGVTVKVIAWTLGAPTPFNVDGLARRLGLRHRNRKGVAFRILAPDVLLAFERRHGDPVDLVQKIFRLCPHAMTEADGLRALSDYREAIEKMPPRLLALPLEMRGIERRKPCRPPSRLIEAQRGRFLMVQGRDQIAA